MAKSKKELVIPYTPPLDLYIYFYVGDKYYKRMQPIPYAYEKPDYKILRKKISKIEK